MSMDSEQYFVKKKTYLFEWEGEFIYSALLSYYLLNIINNRRDFFIKDYPSIGNVEIDLSSLYTPSQ